MTKPVLPLSMSVFWFNKDIHYLIANVILACSSICCSPLLPYRSPRCNAKKDNKCCLNAARNHSELFVTTFFASNPQLCHLCFDFIVLFSSDLVSLLHLGICLVQLPYVSRCCIDRVILSYRLPIEPGFWLHCFPGIIHPTSDCVPQHLS